MHISALICIQYCLTSHFLTLLSEMPPQQLLSSNANPSIPLSSWPIIKYSYSVSLPSSSAQSPWTHFAHRDNIFLVIDTQHVPGYIKNDGKFPDQRTILKIVWGLETLESLDLTSLVQQITPIRDLQQPKKPAFIALGRSPSLAIRYIKVEDKTVHRFQIKFLSDTAYQSAIVLLERADCPVGNPSISRDGTKYLSSQSQIRPQPSYCQIQHTPPGTSSGYSNTSTSSGGTIRGETHSPNSIFAYLNNISPAQSRDLAVPVTAMTGIPTLLGHHEPSRVPQASSHSNLTYSYLPDVTVSSNEFLEDLPPPRPPLAFGPREAPNLSPAYGSKPIVISSISNLPPLPKPTPVNKPPPLTRGLSVVPPPGENVPKYQEPRFASSSSVLGVDAFRRGGDSPSVLKKRAGTYIPGLPGIVEEYTKNSNQGDRDSFPVFPCGHKKSEPEPHAPASPSPRQGTSTSNDSTDIRNTNTGRKRKQHGGEREDQGQKKKQKGVVAGNESPCECEEEEFRQIEDFIVNAIHDNDFLRLVERIGGVWQRMGFDEVRENFFGTSVLDKR